MQQVPFKVFLQRSKEQSYHRFRGSYTYSEFHSVVSHLWGPVPKALLLEYSDEDGDRIRISSDAEWAECLRLWAERNTPGAPLRIIVRRNKREDKHRHRKHEESEDEATDAPQSKVPRLPNIAIARNPLDLDTPEQEEEEDAPSSVGHDPAACAAPAPMQETELGDHHVVMDLLSLVFNCDAAKTLMAGNEGCLASVVRRTPNTADPTEIHLDIDRQALFQRAVQRGNALLDKKQFVAAEAILRTALALYPDSMLLEYNLACALSLQGKAEEGIEFLRLAMAHGYDNIDHMNSDPDLVAIRNLPGYQQLVPAVLPATVVTPRVAFNSNRSVDPSDCAASTVPVQAEPEAPAAVPPVPNKESSETIPPSVRTLMSVFPSLTVAEAKAALLRSNGNLSVAVNSLLRYQ